MNNKTRTAQAIRVGVAIGAVISATVVYFALSRQSPHRVAAIIAVAAAIVGYGVSRWSAEIGIHRSRAETGG